MGQRSSEGGQIKVPDKTKKKVKSFLKKSTRDGESCKESTVPKGERGEEKRPAALR